MVTILSRTPPGAAAFSEIDFRVGSVYVWNRFMDKADLNEGAIVSAALKLPEEQRSAFLQQACGENAQARQRIEARIRESEQSTDTTLSAPPGHRVGLPSTFLDKPGDRLGPYTLVSAIGAGGMGTVWKAERREPIQLTVAIKLIKQGISSPEAMARFEAERHALALMDHPNIARIFDAGMTTDGRPFFVMELVELGKPITTYCDDKGLSIKERLELFIPVCQAIQHAHQKGIIHRDIKPHNVLVAEYDGVPIPKVIDFGVSKAVQRPLTEETLLTELGKPPGTLGYMSPEQVEPNQVDIDTRSDIYSLGVLLYELLTGTIPLARETLLKAAYIEVLRRIREEEAPRPSLRLRTQTADDQTTTARRRHTDPPRLVNLVRGDLDWIVAKCLEKDRARRYASANGLAAELQRHLNNEPLADTRPPSQAYRFKKMVQRNKLVFAAAATVAVVLVVSSLVSAWQAVRARRAERTALTERGEAVNARNEAEQAREHQTALRTLAEQRGQEVRRNLYLAQMNLAGRTADLPGGLGETAELLSAWRYSKPDLRGWEWYYLNGLCHSELMTIREGLGPVGWSPDGSKLASAGENGTVKVFSAANGNEIFTLQCRTGTVSSVTWSPDGLRLAAGLGGGGKAVEIWDATSGKELLMLHGHTDRVRGVAWSPNGQALASVGYDRTVRIWDATNGNELHNYALDVSALAWSPDSMRLALAGVTNPIVLDLATGNASTLPGTIPDGVLTIAWNADGKRLAYSGNVFDIYIVDSTTGQRLAVLRGHSNSVLSLAWSPDGTQLASTSGDWTVRVWDVAASRQLAAFRGHQGATRSVAWSPDGTRVASTSSDGTLRVWTTATSLESVRTLLHTNQAAASVAWSLDGKQIASGGSKGKIRIWNAATGEELQRIQGKDAWYWSVAWSPDGKSLVSNGDLTGAKVWDVATGKDTHDLGSNTVSRAVAWSPDGQRLATGGAENTARVWDATTGRELVVFHGHHSEVTALSWEPGGARVASASADSLRIWDAVTGKESLAIPQSNPVWLRHLSWNRSGSRLASTRDDGLAKVWDAATGEELLTLRGHSGAVYWVEWNSDGTRIATGSWDRTVKVWDSVTGEQVSSFANPAAVASIAWGGPDGTQIAAACWDGTVLIRDAMLGYAVERSARALPWLDRRLASEPKNPRLLQLRAEIRAGQGNWDEAASDMRQCLELPQNHTCRWYQAGWWIVGPYPEGLNHTNAPESNPDPAAPVDAAPSRAEPKPAQLRWQPLPLEVNPQVNFQAALEKAEHMSAYAFQGVYSSEPQTVAILVNSNDPFRLWLNGKLIHENAAAQPVGGSQIIPTVLQAGWNKLLVRVSHGAGTLALSLRLSEQPPPSNSSLPGPGRP